MGPAIAFFLALALWPVLVQSGILAVFLFSSLTHLPVIHSLYGFRSWLWAAFAVTLIAQAIGMTLVLKAPFSGFPGSLAIQTSALIGLLLSAWSLFGWILATETTWRSRFKEETLDAHLQAF